MEWFDAELELKLTSGSTTVNQDSKDPKIVPYMQEGVMGLMVLSTFLDTTFGCFIDGVELGNTSLIIYPKYLVLEESQGWSCRKSPQLLFPLIFSIDKIMALCYSSKFVLSSLA